MRVTFEPAARDELNDIFAWIAKDNPRAAQAMIGRIEAKVMRLETPELTNMGRPGLVEGTRELLEWPYIVVYRVDEARIYDYVGQGEPMLAKMAAKRRAGYHSLGYRMTDSADLFSP